MASAGWVSFSWIATCVEEDIKVKATVAQVWLPWPHPCWAKAKWNANLPWNALACITYSTDLALKQRSKSDRKSSSPQLSPLGSRTEYLPGLERHQTQFRHDPRSQTWRLWSVGWHLARWRPPQSTPASIWAPSLQKTSSQRDEWVAHSVTCGQTLTGVSAQRTLRLKPTGHRVEDGWWDTKH